MEDAHTTILNLDGKTGDEKASFFSVYDGHGGSTVAEFSGQTVHKTLVETQEYKDGDYAAALKRAFLGTDEQLRASPQYENDPSGCTAVAALLVKTPKKPEEKAAETPKPGTPEKVARKIYVANSGDSRAVLAIAGEAKPMSYDHKPDNAGENARIVSAGGFVEFGRVNGNLALSRALGDFEFKQNPDLAPEEQIVTANPDIEAHDVTGEEEFLVLACDGIWDCLSNQQVVDYVRRGLAQGQEPKVLCEEIMDKCLAPPSEVGGIGCDNMTIEIIALLGGRTKEEYYAWIQDRVKNGVGYNTPETIPEVFRSRGGSGLGPDGSIAGGVGDDDDDEEEEEEDGEGGIPLGPSEGGEGGPPTMSLFSALAGGLQNEEGEGRGEALRLPNTLAQALANAGIVLRGYDGTAANRDEGDDVREAHIVEESDDNSEDEDHVEDEDEHRNAHEPDARQPKPTTAQDGHNNKDRSADSGSEPPQSTTTVTHSHEGASAPPRSPKTGETPQLVTSPTPLETPTTSRT